MSTNLTGRLGVNVKKKLVTIVPQVTQVLRKQDRGLAAAAISPKLKERHNVQDSPLRKLQLVIMHQHAVHKLVGLNGALAKENGSKIYN